MARQPAGGVIEGALRLTAADGERVERALQFCPGTSRTDGGLGGNVALRLLRGKKLTAQRQLARLTLQGIQLGIFVQRGIEIGADAGNVACRDQHKQLPRGAVAELLLRCGIGLRFSQGLLKDAALFVMYAADFAAAIRIYNKESEQCNAGKNTPGHRDSGRQRLNGHKRGK